jgi:hypothetical protein
MAAKRAKAAPVETRSADEFRDPKLGWIYRFPIPAVLHRGWGRIVVCLEPVVERGVIRCLYVWFQMHNTPSLEGCFEIPTPQATRDTGLTTFDHGGGVASFFAGVQSVHLCREHRRLAFKSHPPDGTTALVISTLTTSINVHYQMKPEVPR